MTSPLMTHKLHITSFSATITSHFSLTLLFVHFFQIIDFLVYIRLLKFHFAHFFGQKNQFRVVFDFFKKISRAHLLVFLAEFFSICKQLTSYTHRLTKFLVNSALLARNFTLKKLLENFHQIYETWRCSRMCTKPYPNCRYLPNKFKRSSKKTLFLKVKNYRAFQRCPIQSDDCAT